MPASVVMSAEDMVDASLVGLDNGEVVTIPGLQDGDDWTKFEADRKAISKKFGSSYPAPRYRAKNWLQSDPHNYSYGERTARRSPSTIGQLVRFAGRPLEVGCRSRKTGP